MDEEISCDDAVVCPHCGHRHTEFCDYGDIEDDRDWECSDCGKPFKAYATCSWIYWSRKE